MAADKNNANINNIVNVDIKQQLRKWDTVKKDMLQKMYLK